MSHEEDAHHFLEKADGADFSEMTKKDTQMWLFGVKKKLSGRYETEVEGFEDDYEIRLTSTEDHAEFVIDRRRDGVEVNAFVLVDGETKVNEVLRY